MPLQTDDPSLTQLDPQIDLAPTFNQKLTAAMSDAWNTSSGPVAEDWVNSRFSNLVDVDPVNMQVQQQQPAALLNQDQVNAKISAAGYDPKDINITPNKYNDGVVDDLIDRHRQQIVNREIENKTPWDLGSPIRGAGILAAGALDPLTAISAFFPAAKLATVFKLSKLATILEGLEVAGKTGATLASRTAARAGLGAVEGLTGTAVLEPGYSYMRNDLGDDYSMYDSAVNMAGGALFGGLLHPLMGGFGDLVHGDHGNVEGVKAVDNAAERSSPNEPVPIGDEQQAEPNMQQLAPTEEQSAAPLVNDTPINDKSQSLQDTQVKELPNEQANTGTTSPEFDPDLPPTEKLLLGSQDVKPFDADLLGDKYNLADDSRQAIALLNGEDLNAEPTPAASTLASWINERTTTPRMVSEVMDRYHDDISAQLKDQELGNRLEPINKLDTLEKHIDQVQPNAAEKVAAISPDTLQTATRIGMSQFADGREPMVEKLVDNDPAIAKSSSEDVRQEYADSLSPDNSYVAKETPAVDLDNIDKKMVPEDTNFNDMPTSKMQAETNAIKAETDDLIKQLRDEGALYSKVTDNTELNSNEVQNSLIDPKEELTKELRNSFGKSTQKLIDSSLVTVLNDANELPARLDGVAHPENVKAATMGGKVYVIAKNVSAREAAGIMLHEVGVHAGMQRMLGIDKFNKVLDNVDRLIKSGDQFAQLAKDMVPTDTPAEHVREEQLAYMMEYSPTHPLVQKVIAQVRAWLYKNFDFAKDFNLTNADIWALTKASLHQVAKDSAELTHGETMYSRIGTPEAMQSFKDELDSYSEAEKATENYTSGLRSIFNISDKDQAKLTLRKNVPGLTLANADKLVNKFTRKVNAFEKEKSQGLTPNEFVGMSTQERAMQSIRDQELYDLAVARRSSVFNHRSQIDMYNRINNGFMQPNELGMLGNKAAEGAYSVTKGSKLSRPDSNVSIGARQKMFVNKYMGSLNKELDQAGLWQYFSSSNSEDEIMRAQLALNRGADTTGFSKESLHVATVINKIYDKSIEDRNLRGTTIRKNKQYAFDNSYLFDRDTVRKISLEEYTKDMMERLDLNEMSTRQDVDIETIKNEIPEIRDNFSKGRNYKYTDDEVEDSFFGGPNIAKTTAKSRNLIWKSDADQVYMFKKYGNKRYSEAVGSTLEKAGKQAGLLDVAGPSYETNIKKVMDAVGSNIVNDKERDYFNATVKRQIDYDLQFLDGRSRIPLNHTLARVSGIIRSNNRMAMLMSSLLSQVSDLANAASSIKFQGGAGYMTTVPKLIKGMFSRYNDKEATGILKSMGVVSDSYMSMAFDNSGVEDQAGKIFSAMERVAMKLSMTNMWTHKMHVISGDAFAANLGHYKDTAHESLPDTLRRSLSDYGIGKDEWDVMRQGSRKVKGDDWIAPDFMQDLKPQMQESVAKRFPDLTTEQLEKRTTGALNKLENDVYSYMSDLIDGSTAEPTTRTKIAVAGHAPKGTWSGELNNMFMQFKMFPLSYMQNVVGREVYKRGYDSLKDYVLKGKGDTMGLVQLILASTLCGGVSMALKDLKNGKTPRSYFGADWNTAKTWTAAMAQGGGLGIYGDFLFSDVSRLQSGPFEALSGPSIGNIGSALILAAQSRDYLVDDSGKAPPLSRAFNLALGNVPLVNSFFIKPLLNYLFLYHIQDQLNPGFLSRQESKLRQSTGQEYYPAMHTDAWR